VRAVLSGLVLMFGCYHPSVNADTPCSPDDTCPGSLVCDRSVTPPTCVTKISDAPIADIATEDVPMLCFDASDVGLHVCLEQAPTGSMSLTSTTIDTTAGAECAMLMPGSTDACVVAAKDLDVAAGATVAAKGSRPLVLIGSEMITVTGTLDVASHLTGSLANNVGPVANAPACQAGMGPNDRGGGAGGSYRGVGGDGGDESGTDDTAGSAGAIIPLALQGGCAGQNGGNMGGAGGAGGGAVVLISPAITIASTGIIDASGAGGGGGGTNGQTRGGGGGGSGGLVVLQSMSVTGTAGGQVFANGGGGGGGSNAQIVADDGADPIGAAMKPSGGMAGGQAGNGGDGFYSSNPAASGDAGTNGTDAGGGGGGGAGVIDLPAGAKIEGGALFSPSPS
jgi:hypothetical protein